METREVQYKRRTASFAASEEGTKVVFSENYKYYHFRNDGGGTVYVSAYPDVGEGVDGTKSIADGGCGYVFSGDDHVFVKGAAKVTVEASNLPECPFKSAQRGGDITAKGNPVQIDGLQGGVPFSEIAVSGKNLLPSDYMAKSGTYNGVTVIVKDNGRFDVSGTPTKSFALLTFTPSKYYLEGGKQYTFSCNHKYDINTFNIFARVYNKNGVQIQGISTYPTTITANDGDYFSWVLWVTENYEISATDVEVQLEYGDTATEYEPPITGRELTVNVNGSDYTITPDSNPYTVPNDIRQLDGLNNISVSEGEISVVGVRKNAAIKRIWDEIDEIKTAIIVSNGESE